MDRLLLEKLLEWKGRQKRKPLLIDGARQVGKSYILKEQLATYFPTTHFVDFLQDKSVRKVFEGDLKPEVLVSKLEIVLDTEIDLTKDLLILDEIGACRGAVDALKFIAEQQPSWYVAASGSNVGLLDSFPVGKVESHSLRPLNFEEFVMALASDPLSKAYQRCDRSSVVHNKLWSLLVDYLFVGGMPEVVSYWLESSSEALVTRRKRVQDIQKNILLGFERDFGKYAGRNNALHLNTVFRNIPNQLQNYLESSVKRYRFSGVIEKKRGYRDFINIIHWLEKTYLASKSYVVSKPEVPLKAFRSESFFKLFFVDVGLLGFDLGISRSVLDMKDVLYKGPIVENFVQNELLSYGRRETYSWVEKTSQVEFLLQDGENIVPVEVKAGKNTKARSLSVYSKKYQPNKTVKLIGSVGGTDPSRVVLPLYYTKFL